MSARDVIAEAAQQRMLQPVYAHQTFGGEIADAVIAAVRSMPVEDQAELIGGTVSATWTDGAAQIWKPASQ